VPQPDLRPTCSFEPPSMDRPNLRRSWRLLQV